MTECRPPVPGTLEVRSHVRISTLALRPVALGLLLLGLVGGNAAYAATARTVTITVDGHKQHVSTHAGTVSGVLADARLKVGGHDLLAPAPSTRMTDGVSIVLRRGRQMDLTVDGVDRTVWVTALSVNEALSQIGLRSNDALLSADRTREIPLKGFSLDVRTRKDIQLLDAGAVHRTATHALVVSELLRELKVKLGAQDKVSVLGTAPVRDGMVISITRVSGRQVRVDVPIPFGVERRADASMYVGTSKVLRPGSVGVVHRVYAVAFVNHKLSSRKLISQKIMASPTAKVVAYGTKPKPQAQRSVSGTSGLNWAALARCESGGNPRAVSSGGRYRGLYQFALSTWHSVGGSGDPIDASSSEQTYRAKLLYRRAGRSAWPTCGRYL